MTTKHSTLDFKTLDGVNVVRVKSSSYGGPVEHPDTIENTSRNYTNDYAYNEFSGSNGPKLQLFTDKPIDIESYSEVPDKLTSGMEVALDNAEVIASMIINTHYDPKALSHDEVVSTIMDYVYDTAIKPNLPESDDDAVTEEDDFEEDGDFDADEFCDD